MARAGVLASLEHDLVRDRAAGRFDGGEVAREVALVTMERPIDQVAHQLCARDPTSRREAIEGLDLGVVKVDVRALYTPYYTSHRRMPPPC